MVVKLCSFRRVTLLRSRSSGINLVALLCKLCSVYMSVLRSGIQDCILNEERQVAIAAEDKRPNGKTEHPSG